MIDDLATDGMSEAVFLNALEQAEADLMKTFAFIDFDVFPTAHSHVSLAKLRDIVDCARKDQFFGLLMLEEVKKLIEDPAHWSCQRGCIAGLKYVFQPSAAQASWILSPPRNRSSSGATKLARK